MISPRFLILVFLLFSLTGAEKVWGQCGPCNVTLTANNNPAISDGDVVCVTANRSANINFNNRIGITICINSGVTLTNNRITSLSGLSVINNYGILNFESANGSWTINNFGLINYESDAINTNRTINNFGTFVRDGSLSISGSYSSSGTTSIDRDFTINSQGVVDNSGNLSISRDFTNSGIFNSSSGEVSVVRDLTNNSNGLLNLGNTSISRNFTNNGLTTIAGAVEIGNDLTNNSNGIFRPFNTNQCNSLSVSDDFGNNNTNGITGSNLTGPYRAPLIVNQAPSPRGLVGNAIVDPNLDCSCGSTFTNSGSFIVPAGVTQITMKAWGGGGKGGDRNSNDGRSGGGGAGAYSESTLTVTPGETLYYLSGAGSTTTDPGGDSWVSRASNGSNPILLAKGGLSVPNNDEDGALGGRADQGVGTGTSGGNGSDGGGNGGDGGDSPNGGSGGPGANSNNSAGSAGDFPGGGGGGAKTNNNGNTRNGGFGGNGQITFSYSCEESVDPPGGGCWRYIDDGTSSGVVILEFFEDCTWDAPKGLLEFEILAIGGGGGGGVRSGGGGGGGGAVHARALVEVILNQGLAAGTSFPIVVGNGGEGSSVRNEKGENGLESRFDFGGDYQIVAGAGGGGGSDDNNADDGNPGSGSSYNSSTTGFSIISSEIYGGSGGGGGHNGNRGNGSFRNGGNAAAHSGAGGGGLSGNNGSNAVDDERGGNGANGRRFSTFDITLNRFFGAGGAGGSKEDFTATGGSSGAGGNGGREEDNDATNGGNGTTPGSGGGGGGHDENVGGGRGAKGVVIVRYEIARILPVEFLYFNAIYQNSNRSGDLKWATAQEWETSHFEIERSVNDTRNWTKVGEVTSKGYSDIPVVYSFTDLNLPASGGNIFYRLKQVDLKGDFQYSATRAIQVEALDGSTSWIAYPNPSAMRSSITVDLLDRSGYADETILIRISDARGILESYSVSNPDEVSSVVNSYLDLARPGLHILQLIWGNKSEQIKLIRK